jgi:glycosyltransferase involved in cell wall biosynthesis
MGGVEVAVDALATTLTGRGHTVTHVTSSAGAVADEPARDYTQIRVPAINPLEARFGVPYPFFGPGLVTVLRREIGRADVAHTHGYIYPGSVAAAAFTGRTTPPTPLVLTEHVGHVPYDFALLDRGQAFAIRSLGLRVLRRSDAVITYNDRVASQLVALCPTVVPMTILNGVDTALFHPPDEAERSRLRAELGWDDHPRVLFVGRPVAKKGFTDAVSAVGEARPPGIALVVAGSDRLPAGTPDRVTSLGQLSRPRLAEIYRACDALIAPARGEGFPLAAQEALVSGLPLLIADDPGYAPNLVGAGPGVCLVSRSADFPAALTALLGNSQSLRDARLAAAAHAREAFSWDRAADRHEALYRRLLSRPAAQPP